ncbi:aldehyde dehydrogenase family protein [Streptomyces yaizuensis]|uniref:Aldehyde dehydrogenase family protein n=1 Tax=Streptomyces yaizuensis TaxID=2989713 RepID=A0ABQ5P3K1_9ACTN|nr:aldehyde dehydrogenase family protein [Streptomyces sp. YSPA8]GLF97150.1 aldehyde dehydrogenase family protein [Streptomyces sp. YSPA8]
MTDPTIPTAPTSPTGLPGGVGGVGPRPGHQPLFLGGEYAHGTGPERYEVISPATGEPVGSLTLPSAADLDRAVAAAHTAQRAWAGVNVWERAAVCHRIADELDRRREELVLLQTLEQGKPLAESTADVTEAAQLFRLHAEDAVRLTGETLLSRDNTKRMFTFHRPVGTWGVITPWNFPLLMFAEFAAPGLATGNALVVKPSAHTPLTVLRAMEALTAAGLPKGLVSVLPGAGDFGEALVRHPGIHAIGFIGSSATGARIQAAAGLKRTLMECSGNGPLVVLADADVAAAAKAAVAGAYPCAGQVCCATERVVVHADVHDEFVAAVLGEAERVVLGDPLDAKTLLGPLNNEAVARKMDRHVADARERGARVLLGGRRRAGMPTDLYYEFTVVDAVPEDSLLAKEESFGPVVPVITGRDEDDLLRIANDDALGLQGAVFTRSMTSAYRFMEEMAVGQVIVNETNNWWDINMPFGGAGGRATGWGRIGGKNSLLDMTDLRTGVISL